MKQSSDQKERHRQFLLGNLPEQQAEDLEERIFLDPDLAEDLQIEEEELIADYHSGALSEAERQLFEQKYHSTEVNNQMLEYEATFREFVASKPPSERRLNLETNRIRTPKTELIELGNRQSPVDAVSSWLRSLFTSRPALAYSTAALGFIILAFAIWYLLPSRGGPSYSAERRATEAALETLNAPTKIAALGFGNAVELKPVQRFGDEAVRVGGENVTTDGLIRFRLNLTEGNASAYNATFLNEKHNELFTVPNIPVRATPTGAQLWIVVPIRYLNRGDYQIELTDAASGSSTPSNSYPFRMTLEN